jgi:hypothetical protein
MKAHGMKVSHRVNEQLAAVPLGSDQRRHSACKVLARPQFWSLVFRNGHEERGYCFARRVEKRVK